MRRLNLQLYGRTTKQDFSEALSSRANVPLTPEPVTTSLELKAPAGQRFVELRLDPDDKPTQFALHGLQIRSSSGDVVFRWNGDPETLTNLIDLRASESHEEVLVETLSDDPFALFPLKEELADYVVLELTVSQALSVPEIGDDALAVRALSGHQQELSEAVRSLQGSLRLALDDLAAEQEGLQDALVVQHAYARSESDVVKGHLDQITGRLRTVASHLSAFEIAFGTQLEEATTGMRNAILAEVREDWRSLGRQIEARAAEALKDAKQRAEALATRDEELTGFMSKLDRFSQSHELMRQVRTELGALNDQDCVPKLQQLKAGLQSSQVRLAELENSLCWRLMRTWRR